MARVNPTVETLNGVSERATSAKRKRDSENSQIPRRKVRTDTNHSARAQGDPYTFPVSQEPEVSASTAKNSHNASEAPNGSAASPSSLRRSDRINHQQTSNSELQSTTANSQPADTAINRVENQRGETSQRRKRGRPKKNMDGKDLNGNQKTENTALPQRDLPEPEELDQAGTVDMQASQVSENAATHSNQPRSPRNEEEIHVTSDEDEDAIRSTEENLATPEDARVDEDSSEPRNGKLSDFEAACNLLDCGQHWRPILEAAEEIKTAAVGKGLKTSPMKSLRNRIRKIRPLYRALHQARSGGSSSDVLEKQMIVKDAFSRIKTQISDFKSAGSDRSTRRSIYDVYFHIIPALTFLLKDVLTSAHQTQMSLQEPVIMELLDIMRVTQQLCVKASQREPRPVLGGAVKKNTHNVIKPRLDKVILLYKGHLAEKMTAKAAELEAQQAEELRVRAEENAALRYREKMERIAANRRAAELCIARLPRSEDFYMRYSNYRAYAEPANVMRPLRKGNEHNRLSNRLSIGLFMDDTVNGNDVGESHPERRLNNGTGSHSGVSTPPNIPTDSFRRESPEIIERTPLRPLAPKLAENRPGRAQVAKKEVNLDRGWDRVELEALILGLQMYRDPQNRYWDILQRYGKEAGDPLVFRDIGDTRQQAKHLKQQYLSSEAMQNGGPLEWLLSVED